MAQGTGAVRQDTSHFFWDLTFHSFQNTPIPERVEEIRRITGKPIPAEVARVFEQAKAKYDEGDHAEAEFLAFLAMSAL